MIDIILHVLEVDSEAEAWPDGPSWLDFLDLCLSGNKVGNVPVKFREHMGKPKYMTWHAFVTSIAGGNCHEVCYNYIQDKINGLEKEKLFIKGYVAPFPSKYILQNTTEEPDDLPWNI